MKTLRFLRKNWGVPLMVCGALAFIVGDTKEGNDAESDDTASEGFKGLPKWVQLVAFWVIGFICCHLAEWKIGGDEVTVNAETVNVKGDLNIEEKP